MREKHAAQSRAASLMHLLEQPAHGVPDPLRERLRAACTWLALSAEGLALCAEVCLRHRWQERDPAADRVAFANAIAALDAFDRREIRPLATDPALPHQVVMLLDFRRVADILAEASRAIARAELAA